MKYILTILFLFITNLTLGQTKLPSDTMSANRNFDKVLADKLGCDEYGMKKYFLVILRTGTNASSDKEFINESFRGHMNNINRLVEEGKLIVAGPIEKNEKNFRGIFILNNIESIDEAKKIVEIDPAIKNGLLDFDLFTWYGSAALPEYLPFSEKIWKIKP